MHRPPGISGVKVGTFNEMPIPCTNSNQRLQTEHHHGHRLSDLTSTEQAEVTATIQAFYGEARCQLLTSTPGCVRLRSSRRRRALCPTLSAISNICIVSALARDQALLFPRHVAPDRSNALAYSDSGAVPTLQHCGHQWMRPRPKIPGPDGEPSPTSPQQSMCFTRRCLLERWGQ